MKIIGLILTYNCANIVEKAIKNIPPNILSDLICCDDGSKDNIKHVMVKNNIQAAKPSVPQCSKINGTEIKLNKLN